MFFCRICQVELNYVREKGPRIAKVIPKNSIMLSYHHPLPHLTHTHTDIQEFLNDYNYRQIDQWNRKLQNKPNILHKPDITNLELYVSGERREYLMNNAGIIDRSPLYSIYKNEFQVKLNTKINKILEGITITSVEHGRDYWLPTTCLYQYL